MAQVQYCTTAQVAAEAKVSAFSASTTPTATRVGEMIDEESAKIDSYLAARYALPLASDDGANAFVRKIAVALVVERVRNILASTNAAPKLNQGEEFAIASSIKAAHADLRLLAEGKIVLRGQTSATTEAGVSERVSDVDEGVDPRFYHGTRQW